MLRAAGVGVGVGLGIAAFLAVGAVGCVDHDSFECSSSAECVRGGETGTCESEGYCSFPDPECASGKRFEVNAAGELAGACVAPGDPDAGPCGGVGNACCAEGGCEEGAVCGEEGVCEPCGAIGSACCEGGVCGDNGFCEANTCRQCAAEIAMGRRHGCLLRYDGTVWCFGENDKGQHGAGTAEEATSATPIQVIATSESNPVDDVTAIGAGREHTCAVRAGGSVWCWGSNEKGQLGNGESGEDVHSPAAVQVLKAGDMTPLGDIVEVAGGDCFTCAREEGGPIWCWGCNAGGQLGDGTNGEDRPGAAEVLAAPMGSPFTGAVEIAAGGAHTCARRGDDSVWCWGRNGSGQIGDGTEENRNAPVSVFTASAFDTGRYHTCAVKLDGTVWCWGQGWRGRLGDGQEWENRLSPVPVVMTPGGEGLEGASDVAAGGVSCARSEDERAYCWGTNQYGQTGAGAGGLTPLPVRLDGGEPLESIERLSAKYSRACAFLTGGDLVCWGRNSEGQLGDGTRQSRGFPTPVSLSCP